MPKVGTTSAAEMLVLYKLLVSQDWPLGIRQLLDSALSNINDSWFENSLSKALPHLRHKTGSMIDCGPLGETVYNAVGDFIHNGQRLYFCILSHGWLNKGSTASAASMRRHIADYFNENLLRLNEQ